MTFAGRRARQHVGRLSLLALVVMIVVTGIGGIDGLVERALTTGAARMLADAEPSAQTMRVVVTASDDEGSQDDAVRDAIATTFSADDVVVSRQAAATATVETAKGSTFPIQLLDDVRAPDLASLTGGEWPQSPDQIALQESAAQRQQLRIGDTLTVAGEDTVLTLTGTWIATTPDDPAWHGDPSVASGASDEAIGPAIVAHDALTSFTATPTITWEIAPVDITPRSIADLQQALATLRALPDAVDPQRQHNTRILGDLGETLQRQSTAVTVTRGLIFAPLLIIALLGALVIGVVLATLAISRRDELVLLRARGASRRGLVRDAAAEAALSAAVGGALALALLAIFDSFTAGTVLTAVGAIAFAAFAAALLTVRSAGRADDGGVEAARSDAGTRALPMLIVTAVIAAGVAAFATWQLFATGGVIGTDGTTEPLAAAAPALLLIAACGLVPVAAAPLAALFERMLRRTRGTVILPFRQVARRMGSVAVAILSLALAAASVTLAVAAPSAAATGEQHARTASLGWDVRMISADSLSTSAVEAAAWGGVTDAAEVLRTPLSVGSDTAVLVAGPPNTLDTVVHTPPLIDGAITAVVTRSLADRLGVHPGEIFTARLRGSPRPVSLEVAHIVDSLPSVGGGWGVGVDLEELHAEGTDLPPNELWLRGNDPEDLAAQLREQATHPVRILTSAQVSAQPVTSVAPSILAAGALVAAVLGIIGFLAASSATARSRRGEALILHALGMRPARQRALRGGETAGIALFAVLAGCALGTGVTAAVLPLMLGLGT